MSNLRWLFIPGFVFVGINFLAALIFIYNDRRLLLVLLPLILQQILSHSIYGIEDYQQPASIVVFLTMPILGIMILIAQKEKRIL